MKLSLLHLNIWEGTFIDKVVEYVHSYDFDIIHFQEVNGGQAARGGVSYQPNTPTTPSKEALNQNAKGIDSFRVLKEKLREYIGYQLVTWTVNESAEDYAGIATFVKPELGIVRQEIIRHNPVINITDVWDRVIEDDPRASLALLIQKENKKVWFINTHFTWGPTPEDADYKMEQAKKLYDFIQTLKDPFVLSGDFNMTPDTEVVKMFSSLGHNLTLENNITNTLNPHTHKAKHLFPSGFAVDFIITSPEIKSSNFEVIQENLSDHFGLKTNIEMEL